MVAVMLFVGGRPTLWRGGLGCTLSNCAVPFQRVGERGSHVSVTPSSGFWTLVPFPRFLLLALAYHSLPKELTLIPNTNGELEVGNPQGGNHFFCLPEPLVRFHK